MVLAFSFPCPAIGWKVTTGTPAAKASIAVRPPAFSTSASAADIKAGISSVQPMTVPPSPNSMMDARNLSSRPQTVIGW